MLRRDVWRESVCTISSYKLECVQCNLKVLSVSYEVQGNVWTGTHPFCLLIVTTRGCVCVCVYNRRKGPAAL